MDLRRIRGIVLQAIFSNEELGKLIVLKGGNALDMVHGLISRGSIDLDFSISGDFDDISGAKVQILSSVEREFSKNGYTVFDEKFEVVPTLVGENFMKWWGGYRIEFKIIETDRYEELKGNPKQRRRESVRVDAHQGRRFKIDLSKFEYCEGKVAFYEGNQLCYVYTAEMCAVEKLRSLCQQMPEYCEIVGRTGNPRARDFYDIFQILTQTGLDLALQENHELCSRVFFAKRVPLRLLSKIALMREFHRPDWDSVRNAVQGVVYDFDFYFDYVVQEVLKLESLWVE